MVRHIVWWTLKPEAEGRTAAENAKLIKQRLEALMGRFRPSSPLKCPMTSSRPAPCRST